MEQIIQVTPAELKSELDHRTDLFILDLRNEDEFAQWRIESRHPLETVNLPYFAFLEDEDGHADRLPRDREITLVCAKGGASEYVAGVLAEKGFRVRNLSGGMLAWSDLYVPTIVKTEERDGVLLVQFSRVSKGCLSYLIGSKGEALVVDAGRKSELYAEYARAHGLTIRAVVDTHLHADHISGGRRLAELAGAPYYLPPADARDVTFAYEPLTDGQSIAVGGTAVKALGLLSPGHTEGSTSVLVDNRYLLTGDTLFVYSVGRPDLGGMAETLVQNLYDTLFQRFAHLGDQVEIYPTHFSGPGEFTEDGICCTTLGESRRTNKALQITDRERFAREILADMPPHPANYGRIREINMGRLAVSPDEARETEIGPNRCAAHR